MHSRRHSTFSYNAQFDLSGECIPGYEEAEAYAIGGEPFYPPPQSAPPLNRYSTPSPSQLDFGFPQQQSFIDSAQLSEGNFQLSSFKGPLYTVEFKAGRAELFFLFEVDGKPALDISAGDFVIVEADRGEDLGKVTSSISLERLKKLMSALDEEKKEMEPEIAAVLETCKEIVPKRIHRKASPGDLKLLQAKAQEEAIAMVRCQSRVRQKCLPMEVVDAEYQWDRNKLTFFFYSEKRIDFRELVRDLFRIYKTRIWMCAVDRSRRKLDLEPHQEILEKEFLPDDNINSTSDLFVSNQPCDVIREEELKIYEQYE